MEGLLQMPEFLVPDGDGVIAGRNVLPGERAVGACDGEVGMIHHSDIGMHPGVDIAFDGDHDFLAGEAVLDGGRAGCLLLVPLAVVDGEGMDVMGDGVAVLKREDLAGADADDAGDEHAAVLIEDNGLGVGLELLAFEAGLDIDEGVGEASAAAGEDGLVV